MCSMSVSILSSSFNMTWMAHLIRGGSDFGEELRRNMRRAFDVQWYVGK